MNFLLPLGAAILGGGAAVAADHFFPERGVTIAGQRVEPGAIGAGILLGAAFAFKSPALAGVALGGIAAESGLFAGRQLIGATPPPGALPPGTPPAGGGAVAGYGDLAMNDADLAAALSGLEAYVGG